MARGRGRSLRSGGGGRGQGCLSNNGGSPSKSSTNPSPLPNTPDYPCGTCSINIGEEDALECERCAVWTHGGQQCSAIEIREREKRTKSVIVRGLGSDLQTINDRLKDVVSHLLGPNKDITLSHIVPINDDLVRREIVDDVLRKELIQASRNLKTSLNFNKVYIHKDLTYRQRQELQVRRSTKTREWYSKTDNSGPSAQNTRSTDLSSCPVWKNGACGGGVDGGDVPVASGSGGSNPDSGADDVSSLDATVAASLQTSKNQ
ncbi:hypothetical protein Pcinc_023582 [Petrolisthes cinctipes]|uniref:Uncharacterized protein n=1 Tax=Petrolisthes cinctipes TaxID=88211 RepID=A0AAE1KF04_PETCI|nr:hypothetical protein Pcinc_023582 [Petrolisthes cinctipes]